MGVAALALPSSAVAATFSNTAPIAVAAGAPNNGSVYPSTITVPDSYPVFDVNVTLHGVSHTFPDDLGVLLVGPTGSAMLLMDSVGDDPDASDLTLTFDDEAAALAAV